MRTLPLLLGVSLMLHRLIALALIPPLMFASGCSFIFTDIVPDNPAQLKYFDCTSTPGLAVADGVIAVAQGVSGVATFTQSKEEYEAENDGVSRDLVGGIALGLAAVMLASGIYGIVHAETCRHAKNDLETRLLALPPEVQTRSLTPEAPPPAAAPAGQPGEIQMMEIPEQQTPPPATAP